MSISFDRFFFKVDYIVCNNLKFVNTYFGKSHGSIHGLLNRWTSQLDLGSMTGGLERVVSVHNFGSS